jgi:hypothetical protein
MMVKLSTLLAVRLAPYVPQSSEGERLLRFEMNPYRDLAPSFFAPLVETVSGNNAAASIYDMLK